MADSSSNPGTHHSSGRSRSFVFFQLFKYSVYLLLMYNVILFFQDDYSASSHTFKNGVSLGSVVEAFSATVDTASWILLLLLFELETFVLPDSKIHGLTKWSLHGVRSLCYLFIIYALYGYINKLMLILGVSPFQVADVCSLAGSSYAFIETLDEYTLIDPNNCSALIGVDLFQIMGTEIISSAESLAEAQRLAWADVINAFAWVFVVIILEIDVFLQLRGGLQGWVRSFSQYIKVVLYSVLLGAAIYWGFDGAFLDFWDAFLWLVAFIFIEMNIFKWSEELEQEA